MKVLKTFLRHHKEVWKQNFKLIFILIQLSEMHGQEGLNKMRFSNNGAEFEPIRVSVVYLKKLLLNLIL